MSPEEMFRGLRDDARWMDLPPSAREPSGRKADRPLRLVRSWRAAIVTIAVGALIVAGSLALIARTTTPPATTPNQPVVTATQHPTTSPSTQGAASLTPQTTGCGATIPSADFTGLDRGSARLANGTGEADLRIANYAAAGARSTRVSARVFGGSSTTTERGARWAGALHIALVRGTTVVAVATSGSTSGTVGYDQTSLLSATLASRDCSTGAPLADGAYSIVALGPAVTVAGFVLHPVDTRRPVHISDGVLVGEISTAPTGPWHGTGVPTCGSPVNESTVRVFATTTANQLATEGLEVRVTGFETHANRQGRSFVATVTNTGDRTAHPVEDPQSATAVTSDGRIVSAPDSGGAEHDPDRSTLTIKPEKSTRLVADAPITGFDLSADGTVSGPTLAPGPHFAYVDFGTTTSAGTPIVMTITYTGHNDERAIVNQ